MSSNTHSIGWFEECIKEKRINYFEYNEFNSIEEIGSGLIGKVYKAKWKNEKYLVLKSFNLDNDTVKEIICEVCN